MPLSEQEIQQLREKFRDELEEEHKIREQRALRKAERRKSRKDSRRSGPNREEEAIKAEVRSQFYKEHGYEEKLDPTGRRLYLSPEEIKNKQRKRRGKKNNRKSHKQQKDQNQWFIYLFVAIMGIISALALVKSF